MADTSPDLITQVPNGKEARGRELGKQTTTMDAATASRLANLAKAREAKKRKREEEQLRKIEAETIHETPVETVSLGEETTDGDDGYPDTEEPEEPQPPPQKRKKYSHPTPVRKGSTRTVERDEDHSGFSLLHVAYPVVASAILASVFATFSIIREGINSLGGINALVRNSLISKPNDDYYM